MKKVYFVFLFFIIYNSFSESIVNSSYIPDAGKIISNIKIGYLRTNFGEKLGKRKFSTKYLIQEDGKFGLFEDLLVNFGFQYDMKNKYRVYKEKKSMSNELSSFYFGTTARTLDKKYSKIDFIFNLGKQKIPTNLVYSQNYAEFFVRYGFDLNFYTPSIKFGYKYNGSYNDNAFQYLKVKRNHNFIAKLENEFVIANLISINLDFSINHYSKIKGNEMYYPILIANHYNEYEINSSFNYFINSNNVIGLYYNILWNKIKQINYDEETYRYHKHSYKNMRSVSFGIKAVSLF